MNRFRRSPTSVFRPPISLSASSRISSLPNSPLLKTGVSRSRLYSPIVGAVGFASAGRRRALRNTWMPSDPEGLRRLEESTGLAIRFIIGKTKDEAKMAELRREIAEYDDFILLDIEEEYSKLPYKTLAFFKAAYALYDSEFYVKAHDDIYLRPDRLSLLLAKERSHSQTYLGCLKRVLFSPVFTDPKLKWYEPLADLLGKEYFLHAYGPIYALSAEFDDSCFNAIHTMLFLFGEVSNTRNAIQALDKTISSLEMELAAARSVQESLQSSVPVSDDMGKKQPQG